MAQIDGQLLIEIVEQQRNEGLNNLALAQARLAGQTARAERAEKSAEASYALLLACYRSGQIPESAWVEHLKDDGLRAWLDRHDPPAMAADQAAKSDAQPLRSRRPRMGQE